VSRILTLLLLLTTTAFAATAATPWIGLEITRTTGGVLVKQVIPDSPADHAGLAAGDVILTADGTAMTAAGDLINHVQSKGVGAHVTLTLTRAGAKLTVDMALVARPEMLEVMRRALVGRPAPAFDLTEANGPHPASLAGLAGHVVVLEFFATWCGPCTASIETLDRWQADYGKRGLRVVGISDEEQEKLTTHARRHGILYTYAHDPGPMMAAYLVPAVPTFIVIDPAGTVRAVEVGAGDTLDAVEAAFKPLLGDAR
jgi:peroxiredoxin